ncbi:sugar phosphorylase [Alginatibacterium sediminis]|uniref:Sugar phosphorylase n=1 Tax=Alginatibacterium sediminis TaxID=2164068 RepID=A0A420E6T9_9ALTE|nr:sugar phosphorylase [Alginatibacterium sediminis]RKF13745.1 sugar phosphorylase [Alginatibacterium sediminis]
MPAIDTSMATLSKDLQQILAGVYSPAQLKSLVPSLISKANAFSITKPQKLSLDQNDIMLISYGDSIKKDGEAPLHTLRMFLNQHTQHEISAVHLLPCYPFTSDDGFSVIDYWEINSELGGWEDVRALSADYDLMLDAVINHISQSSNWFQGYLEGSEEYQDFFLEADPQLNYGSVTRPRALPLLSAFETSRGLKHVWTTFSSDQIDLNYRSPALFAKVVELLLYYVEQGARYIRLDAIGFMWKELSTPCIHLPQTHALVQAMRAVLDALAPQVKLITETNVPHQDNISYFGNGFNEAHMVYQFPLPPLTMHTLQTGNSDKIVAWMSSLDACSASTTFFNFLSSHDGIGVRPVEGILNPSEVQHLLDVVDANQGRVSYKDNGDGTQSPYELNINYFNAVADKQASMSTNIDRFMAAQTILVSLAGVPGIYIHSLLGSESDLEGLERHGYNRAINRAQLSVDQLQDELKDVDSQRSRVLARFKQLLGTRKTLAAFAPSASQRIVKTDSRVVSLVRDESVAVVVNISNQSLDFDTRLLLPGLSQDLLSQQKITSVTTLAPYQAMWLSA